jgi:hypothetical protein
MQNCAIFCKKIIISHLAADSDITLIEHKTGDGRKCEDCFATSSTVYSCFQVPLLCVIFGLRPGLFMTWNSITYSLINQFTIYTHFLYGDRLAYTPKNVTSLFYNIIDSGNYYGTLLDILKLFLSFKLKLLILYRGMSGFKLYIKII